MEKIKKLLALILLFSFFGCGSGSKKEEVTLLLSGYSAARESFKEIIPLFQKEWFKRTGQNVTVKQSYASSGTQSRAIVAGFPADVAALAVELDIDRLVREGLVAADWKKRNGGMISHSAVVFAVREGNPHGIRQWEDLVTKEIELLMPNPKTSGGAQWTVLSAYGAAYKGKVRGYAGDAAGGKELLADLISKVTVMDKGARESIINFEFGAGDAAVTYESEVLLGQLHGQKYEYVVPRSSVVIENPVAVVNANAKKHGVEEVAEAFVDFLFTNEAQRIFAETGLRPVRPEVMAEFAQKFPFISDYWPVQMLGEWEELSKQFFGAEGIYTKAVEEVRLKQKQ